MVTFRTRKDRVKIMPNKSRRLDEKRAAHILFWLILAIAVFARAYRLNSMPNGINQDEALAGYEAFSLLHYGIDSHGYTFPVYLSAWDSGMNALESYLAIPFVALFGLKVWVFRLPQMIVGVLSVWVVYLLVRRIFNERAGLFAMFMLAICPWHIILSRYGLESNLAPGFMLFGLYFFVRGVENSRFFMLSALMYGLSLYAYATVWVIVPFVILGIAVYAVAYGKIRIDRYCVCSVLIIGVLALPLLAFLAVNYGFIDEICTPFMSVPRLAALRSGEVSLNDASEKLEMLWNVFVLQTDNQVRNSPTKFGLFYYITMPFALFGFVYSFVRAISHIKKKEFSLESLLLIQCIVCMALCVLVMANANRINVVIFNVILYAALGVYYLSTFKLPHVLTVAAAVYFVLFAGFEHYYFTEYDLETREHFSYGLEDALEVACANGETVYVEQYEFYSKVLFYIQTPVDVIHSTGQYIYYPSSKKHPLSFGNFVFYTDTYENIDEAAAYVMPKDYDVGKLPEHGFAVEQYGNYLVAYKPD